MINGKWIHSMPINWMKITEKEDTINSTEINELRFRFPLIHLIRIVNKTMPKSASAHLHWLFCRSLIRLSRTKQKKKRKKKRRILPNQHRFQEISDRYRIALHLQCDTNSINHLVCVCCFVIWNITRNKIVMPCIRKPHTHTFHKASTKEQATNNSIIFTLRHLHLH